MIDKFRKMFVAHEHAIAALRRMSEQHLCGCRSGPCACASSMSEVAGDALTEIEEIEIRRCYVVVKRDPHGQYCVDRVFSNLDAANTYVSHLNPASERLCRNVEGVPWHD